MTGHVESCLMGLRFVAMLRTTSRPFFSGRFFDCTGVIAYHIVLCVAVHDAKAECRDAVEALGVGRDEIIYFENFRTAHACHTYILTLISLHEITFLVAIYY